MVDEATSEPVTEGSTAAGGSDAGKVEADKLLDDVMTGATETDETKKKDAGPAGSFLIDLIRAVGKVQSTLLNRAKDQSDIVVDLSGDTESADAFTTAQAEYSGVMQLFNIYSTQVATTLKT